MKNNATRLMCWIVVDSYLSNVTFLSPHFLFLLSFTLRNNYLSGSNLRGESCCVFKQLIASHTHLHHPVTPPVPMAPFYRITFHQFSSAEITMTGKNQWPGCRNKLGSISFQPSPFRFLNSVQRCKAVVGRGVQKYLIFCVDNLVKFNVTWSFSCTHT